MRLIPRTLKWRTILLTLLGLVAVGVSLWWTFRAEINAFVKRQQLLDKMRNCRHTFDNALGNGELREGMPVEEWVAAHPPKSRFRHDQYESLIYEGSARRDSLCVIAIDGVIVFAGTDTTQPEHTIVGSLSPTEVRAYDASVRRWRQNQIAGRAAVFGVVCAGSPERWDFPTPMTDDLRIDP